MSSPSMNSGQAIPSGTVTFLFTDIEGSTQLWELHPEAMKSALAKHDSLLHGIFLMHNGRIVKTTGDGFHVVFETATDAVQSAIHSQQALQKDAWGEAVIKVRMGIHTGEAELRDDDYYGQTLNLAARIMSVGHGGQILLSETTYQVAREHLPANVSALDLGQPRLKGVTHAGKIFQISTPDLQQEFPPLNTQTHATNNLPTQLTSFIGRERELAEVKTKVESARLLTLIGPGGTGKSRLSIQLGSQLLPAFEDGVWLVEFAPISDPSLVMQTIASVFDIREIPGTPLQVLVHDYLREKHLLLILDNCEHLVESSAKTADDLLRIAPNIRIVVSSREVLGINGETVYRVPSLSLPSDFRSPGDFGSLMQYESVQLFVERASAANPKFQLTDENASYIAQICSRLDGIPLALELAATRTRVLSVEQIAGRLDDRFRLLTGGSRTALPRQQTLRALIDWSYDLLTRPEKALFRRLAVFVGGWTLDAAESVCSGEGVEAYEVLDLLAQLVDKSLVIVEERDEVVRYHRLETIRQYAREKLLETNETTTVRDRHLDYMLQLTEQTGNRMFGAESQEWFDQMELEHDNLRAAFEWGTSMHPEKALKLAYAVGGFWTVRDHISEARAWCQAILEKTKSMPGVDMERARVYSLLAWMSVTSGEHKSGRAAAERAISLGSQTNDLVTVARAHGILALTSVFLGDFPSAQQVAMVGESLARRQGLNSELAFILSVRAQMEYFSRNDVAQAKAYANEAFQLARDEGFLWASSFLSIGMAHTAALLGDLETAREKFTESGEIAGKLGNKRVAYMSQSELAHVLREHGELDEPLGIYKDLLPKWKDLGHRAAVAHELECIAYILTRKEQPERAANLLGAAQELRRVIDIPRTQAEEIEYENEIAALHGMINNEFDEKWEDGRSMTMDEAIELALDE